MEASVAVLRSDRQLTATVVPQDALHLFTLSGRLTGLLGGHGAHVLTVSGLYALWYPLALLSEIVYQYQRFSVLALVACPALFAWVAVTTLGAFLLEWRRALSGAWPSVVVPAGMVMVGAVAPAIALMWWLPPDPIAQLKIQAYAAQAGYFKTSVLYGIPLVAAFLAWPFHSVLEFQRQVRAGNHNEMLSLLLGAPTAISPRGILFVSPRTLWIILGACTIVWLAMTAHLLDNLMPSPYMNAFIFIVEIRSVVWATTAVLGIVWYQRCLNELKRECLARGAMDRAGR